jgi:phosphoglycerate dehydrogenase-like enzyme
MKRGVFILNPEALASIYGEELAAEVGQTVDLVAPPQTADSVLAAPERLREVELVFSGWGGPRMDAAFLEAAPALEAVFYGAGSVRNLVTDAFWERGIRITSAAALNAIPVAEYTLSQVLFSLKRGWAHALAARQQDEAGPRRLPVPGAYGTRVGIVSLGEVGRAVCERLRPFDVEVLAYDPYVPAPTFALLGAVPATLEALFESCEVVSLHAPNLPATRGMIRGEHFARMKPGATFINTARGDVVREDELAAVLARRPDLWAVLDVLAEADRSARSSLVALPNVVLTPHIAGSMGAECRRMGRGMLEELRRYLAGEPLRWEVTRERFERMA